MELCVQNWFNSNPIGYAVMWAAILLISGSFGFYLYRYFRKKYLKGCTQKVDATIVRSKIEEVVYEFVYNGAKCTVRSNGFTYESSRQSSGHNFAYARRQNRVGNTVKLCINPNNPKIFMDENSVKTGRIAFVIISLIGAVIIGAIAYSLLDLACR